jgi:copper(I)-binding protein
MAYAREGAAGRHTVAAYLTIDNRGRERDRLVSANSSRAVAVEIHSMREGAGRMRMRQVSEVRDTGAPAREACRRAACI